MIEMCGSLLSMKEKAARVCSAGGRVVQELSFRSNRDPLCGSCPDVRQSLVAASSVFPQIMELDEDKISRLTLPDYIQFALSLDNASFQWMGLERFNACNDFWRCTHKRLGA